MASGVKLLEGYVEVTADAKGAGKKAAQQIGDEVNSGDGATKTGSGWGKRLVGGIMGSIAVAKIGQFLGASISEASDLNETLNKSNTIFGAQSAAMEKWGETAATSMGLSKAAALEAAAGFGNMFTQLGFTGDQAAAMSQQIVEMSADLGSFNNLPTADVTDMISAAMRGEYDSLQRLIPNINAARVEQEAMAATGKTSAASLTAQEKAAAVLAIVQKDGAAASGDFAKTSGDLANQQKIAAAQTDDLKAALGTGLLPIITTILGVVTTALLPVLQQFAGWLSENTNVIVPLVIGLGVLAIAIWAVNSAMLANPITWIIIGIGLLIAAILLLVMNWDTVVAWITDIWGGFIGWITGVIDGFVGWWNGVWAAVFAFFGQVWNTAVAAVSIIWQGFISFITAVIQGYVGFWNGVWSGIASFFSGIWNGIVNTGRGAISNLIGFFTGLPGQIMGALSGAANWLVNVGSDIVAGLRRGISNAWNNMVSWFTGLFGDLVGIAKNILGIASPSLVFETGVGRWIPAGVEAGVERGMPSLNRTLQNMVAVPGVPGVPAISSPARAAGGAVTNNYRFETIINESTDPLGSSGRVARELKKWSTA